MNTTARDLRFERISPRPIVHLILPLSPRTINHAPDSSGSQGFSLGATLSKKRDQSERQRAKGQREARVRNCLFLALLQKNRRVSFHGPTRDEPRAPRARVSFVGIYTSEKRKKTDESVRLLNDRVLTNDGAGGTKEKGKEERKIRGRATSRSRARRQRPPSARRAPSRCLPRRCAGIYMTEWISIRRVRRERVFVPLRIIGSVSPYGGRCAPMAGRRVKSVPVTSSRDTRYRCFQRQRIIRYRTDRALNSAPSPPPGSSGEKQ